MKFFLVFGILSLVGCGSDSNDDREPNIDKDPDIMEPAPLVDTRPPEVEVIACPEYAGHSDIEEELAEHVTDPHRFLELYLEANPDSQDEPPEINFDEQDVLAVLMGGQPSGSHWVYVSDIHEEGDDLEVVYRLVSPSQGCLVTDQFIYPHCFVAIAKVPGEVTFTREPVTACGLELDGEAMTD